MEEALGGSFGNPSSVHASGERSRGYLLHARESLAQLLGCNPSQIVFTSGGTEANNLIFNLLIARKLRGGRVPRVITTKIEHSSILKMCEYLEEVGVEVILIPTDRSGKIRVQEIESAMTNETDLVSIQWVNNETGVIQPIKEIGAICKSKDILFHTDAAQGVGKIEIDLEALPVDFLSLTAHKFHGPQGIGALYIKDPKSVHPLFWGGAQEGGVRPGTENVPGIAGGGVAADHRFKNFDIIERKIRNIRDLFENMVFHRIPETEVNGDTLDRVCNTSNLLFKGIDGQALVARLDQVGIRCSQSSACTNQRPEPSYVLREMGLSESEAYSSVRFSFSELNTPEELDFVVEQISQICEQMKKFNMIKTPSF
jgi:cysteine desulfurase